MAQQGMPNLIDLYQAASSGFRNTLTGVKADQMGNGTPCSQWNVQQLIKHNINVTGFVRGVFAGNGNVNPMDVSGPLPLQWRTGGPGRWTGGVHLQRRLTPHGRHP